MVLQEHRLCFIVYRYSPFLLYFSYAVINSCQSSLQKVSIFVLFFSSPSTIVASRLCRKACYCFPKTCPLLVFSLSGNSTRQFFWFCMPQMHPTPLISHKASLIQSLSSPAASQHFYYHYSKLIIFFLGLEYLLKWPLQLFSTLRITVSKHKPDHMPPACIKSSDGLLVQLG